MVCSNHPQQCPATYRKVQADADPSIRFVRTTFDAERFPETGVVNDCLLCHWAIIRSGFVCQPENGKCDVDLGDVRKLRQDIGEEPAGDIHTGLGCQLKAAKRFGHVLNVSYLPGLGSQAVGSR